MESSNTLVHPWEPTLLALAAEARQPDRRTPAPAVDQARLQAAYTHCAALTARHSQSFYLASRLLPAPKRRAIHALYAFCRVADDLVDCHGNAAEQLAAFRRQMLAWHPPAGDQIATAWADARRRYRVPLRYAEQLVDGVARDLVQTRYHTFSELAAYAYGVASTVGLMSMYVTGFDGPRAIPYAIKLGVALQVTNVLRDVAEDWGRGRLYLPLTELAEYGLDEHAIAAGHVDERWRAFMRFQIERNRRLYAEAWPGIALLHSDGRRAVSAAATLYRGILDDIEAHDYDVFHRRAHLNLFQKLQRLSALREAAV